MKFGIQSILPARDSRTCSRYRYIEEARARVRRVDAPDGTHSLSIQERETGKDDAVAAVQFTRALTADRNVNECLDFIARTRATISWTYSASEGKLTVSLPAESP